MIAAEVEPALPSGERRSGRAPVSLEAGLVRDGLARALCRVVSLSPHGLRLETYSALKRRTRVLLTLPKIGIRECRVTWAEDFAAGCEFIEPLERSEFKTLVAMDATLDRKDAGMGRKRR